MTIRLATINDIPDIVEIYDELIFLEEKGSGKTGWIRGVYPTIDTAYDALRENSLFVGFENETIVGSAIINKIQPDIYKNANWITSASDNEVMVLHTLSISSAFSGKGYGKDFVHFYENYALMNGCNLLRIDTNVINTPAINLYTTLGYKNIETLSCTYNNLENVEIVLFEKALL